MKTTLQNKYAVTIALAFITVQFAFAQLGSGWIQYSPTKKIHLDNEDGLQTFNWSSYQAVGTGTNCADYSYDAATETETFRIFDSRSNRSEIRLQNEYSTGSRQFEGYVTFYSPLDDECLMQIFGSTSGATQLMNRGFAANGGSINGGGATLITGCYGVEVRMNVIHLQEDKGNKFIIYINGVKKAEVADNEAVTNYHKYGCYGTTNGNVPAIVKWRRTRFYKDGTAPAETETKTYQAENATISQGVVETTNTGYLGTGYVNYNAVTGSYVQWTVNVAKEGSANMSLRYANKGPDDRPMDIYVNGTKVISALSFASTGAWTTWAEKTFSANLNAGNNTIRATATVVAGGPNVDQLKVTSLKNVQEISVGTIEKINLEVSPNPVKNNLQICYKLPEKMQIKLSLSDLMGKEVKTIISQLQDAGSYNYKLDVSDLPAGTYFARLIAGNTSETVKLIVTK